MIQVFKYQESPIQFEEVNGQIMASATSMCGAFGKRFNDWVNLNQTKKYCNAITRKNGISDNQLVITKQGSPENGGGAWIHEKLILSLSRWLNPDFALWCDDRIAELIREGHVSIEPMTTTEVALAHSKNITHSLELLVKHEKEMTEIKTRQLAVEKNVERLNHIQQEAEKELFALPLSDESAPPIELRKQVSILVNKFVASTGIQYQSVWTKLYEELESRYNIRLSAYKRRYEGEKNIDVAERIDGAINKLHIIISDMIKRNTKVA